MLSGIIFILLNPSGWNASSWSFHLPVVLFLISVHYVYTLQLLKLRTVEEKRLPLGEIFYVVQNLSPSFRIVELFEFVLRLSETRLCFMSALLSDVRFCLMRRQLGRWNSLLNSIRFYLIQSSFMYSTFVLLWVSIASNCRSRWSRGPRRGSAAVRLLGLRVGIAAGAWMSVACECCVLSVRGLCVGLITRPEGSYGFCMCLSVIVKRR
jgi:hypothetical protein